MCPGEETELSHVVPLDERQDEPHEAHAVQTERDEPMVRHQELQVVRPINDDSKVINEVLSIEEVVGGQQEIPGEGPEPGESMDAVHGVPNVDDLFETFHLHTQYRDHKSQWSSVDEQAECSNHQPGEDTSDNPVPPS